MGAAFWENMVARGHPNTLNSSRLARRRRFIHVSGWNQGWMTCESHYITEPSTFTTGLSPWARTLFGCGLPPTVKRRSSNTRSASFLAIISSTGSSIRTRITSHDSLYRKAPYFVVDVNLVANLTPTNPFAFFLEPEVESYPFRYSPDLAKDLNLIFQ